MFYTEIGWKEIERFDNPKDKDYIDIFLLIYHSISKYKHGWYRSFVPSGIICFSVDRYIRVRMNLFCNRVYLGSIDVLSSRVCDLHCLFIMVINPCTTQVTPTTTTNLNEIRPYSQSSSFLHCQWCVLPPSKCSRYTQNHRQCVHYHITYEHPSRAWLRVGFVG